MNTRIAPEGQIWVCLACGKTEKDRYGTKDGWDESCMLNSALAYEDKVIRYESGRVKELIEGWQPPGEF